MNSYIQDIYVLSNKQWRHYHINHWLEYLEHALDLGEGKPLPHLDLVHNNLSTIKPIIVKGRKGKYHTRRPNRFVNMDTFNLLKEIEVINAVYEFKQNPIHMCYPTIIRWIKKGRLTHNDLKSMERIDKVTIMSDIDPVWWKARQKKRFINNEELDRTFEDMVKKNSPLATKDATYAEILGDALNGFQCRFKDGNEYSPWYNFQDNGYWGCNEHYDSIVFAKSRMQLNTWESRFKNNH